MPKYGEEGRKCRRFNCGYRIAGSRSTTRGPRHGPRPGATCGSEALIDSACALVAGGLAVETALVGGVLFRLCEHPVRAGLATLRAC
jgi:hypothetical protein